MLSCPFGAISKEKMAVEDKIKIKLLDSLRNKNSELTRIMAFNAFINEFVRCS